MKTIKLSVTNTEWLVWEKKHTRAATVKFVYPDVAVRLTKRDKDKQDVKVNRDISEKLGIWPQQSICSHAIDSHAIDSHATDSIYTCLSFCPCLHVKIYDKA